MLIAKPLPFDVSNADYRAGGGGVLLFGWAVVESSGAASATFDVIDGVDAATGTVLVPISLTMGQSTRDFLGAAPIHVQTGITIGNVVGAVRGALFVTPLAEVPDEWLAVVTAGRT